MTAENPLKDQQHSIYNEIRFLINTQPENKKILNIARAMFLIISNVLIIPFSMFSGGFNPIYFYFSAIKIILIFGLLFSFIYLAIGTLDSAKLWENTATRKKEICGRILHLLKESLLMLIISSTIFGLFHVSGLPQQLQTDFLIENPGTTFPLSYTPSTIELILIITIVMLLFLTFTNIYFWFYSRCVKFTGYNEKKKILKFNLIRTLLGFLINAQIFVIILPIILDELFIATKFPDILASWDNYDRVFTSNAYILLVIELALIVSLNLFYVIDSILANKYRTNFIESEILETVR